MEPARHDKSRHTAPRGRFFLRFGGKVPSSRSSNKIIKSSQPSTVRVIDRSSRDCLRVDTRSLRPLESSPHRPLSNCARVRPVPSFCRRVKSTLNARAIDLERSSHRAIEPSSRPGTAHESTQFIKSSSDPSRWATQPPRTRVRESRLRRLLWFTRVSSTTTANVMCA